MKSEIPRNEIKRFQDCRKNMSCSTRRIKTICVGPQRAGGKASLIVLLASALVAVGTTVWVLVPREIPDVEPPPVELPEVRENTGAIQVPVVRFTDITEAAGIHFVHHNGATGQKLLPETMGGGCAFFDFDNDQDEDILLVNSSSWPWDDAQVNKTTQLYRNSGGGHFEDVTQQAGLGVVCYGLGCAVGDYDNDGDVDVFLSTVGKNRLFRNSGGTFTDVTDQANVAGNENQWSSSCGWFDYDNDGDLDLFVCNYVQWSRETDLAQNFQLVGIGRAYGPPMSFAGSDSYLYRNDGDGTFTDVSAQSGVRQQNAATGLPLAKSLGVAFIDTDQDGWIDIVVANDTVRNFLFHNQRDGTFREVGVEAGIAYDPRGKARGAMGIDAVRFRNNDCLGIAIANFANEMTGLYVSDSSDLIYTDDAIPTGLGPPTRLELSFGLFFFDYDLDGRVDLLSANGHLESEINIVQKSQQYRQSARLFWNAGIEQVTEFVAVDRDKSGDDLTQPIVGRGAAYADIDADGDLDILLTQIAGPPLLLRNDLEQKHNFARFKLIGTADNRDAIGAWIDLRIGSRQWSKQVMPTRSYLSQVELPVTFGLGNETKIDEVFVRWPGGDRQRLDNIKLNATNIVTQGQ